MTIIERATAPASASAAASPPGVPPLLVRQASARDPVSGDVPQNRAVLFDRFVEVLLLRERPAEEAEAAVEPLRLTTEGERLLAALEGLAWHMQSRRGGASR